MTDALFDLAHPPPIRKGGPGYLPELADHTYGGHVVWALAPVDRHVQRLHQADPLTTDFVWLIAEGWQLVWALVDLEHHTVIALDPRRIDQSIWHADEDPA